MLPASTIRSLGQKEYEKRKHAALEVEALVRDLREAGQHEKINSVVKQVSIASAVMATSTSSEYFISPRIITRATSSRISGVPHSLTLSWCLFEARDGAAKSAQANILAAASRAYPNP